jgi:Predicted nucleic acid-binding protein, contains PIN domain
MKCYLMSTRRTKRESNHQSEQARETITAINLLDLEKKDIYGIEDRILELTKKYFLSAYDASYLAIAEKFNLYLITGDEKFYNSVKKDFSFIKFIKDWQEEEVG